MHSHKVTIILQHIFIIFLSSYSELALASFNSGFVCSDSGRYCSSHGGWRVMDGVRIYKACWSYSYSKTCIVPSKNDCGSFAHCYEIGVKDCLLRDSYGNCVNQRKEFSCKRRSLDYLDKAKVKYVPTGEEAKKIVCRGIPCIDGNCVDKAYEMDSDMMSSISQLYGASKLAGSSDLRMQLFPGAHNQCSKKPAGYLNCCKTKGWGSDLGASCTTDEKKTSRCKI